MDLIAQPSMEVPAEGSGLFIHLLGTFVKAAVPLMAAAAAAGVVATFFQTKLLVSGESLRPKLSRISPLQGVKRLFSLRSVVEALKGLLKIAVLLILIFRYITNVLDLFTKYLYTDLLAACAHLFEESFLLSMQIGAAFAVLAAADIFYQWWDYERQIRMSKQEIKEEFKQTEGDPKIKGKIKETQRKMAQSRMMTAGAKGGRGDPEPHPFRGGSALPAGSGPGAHRAGEGAGRTGGQDRAYRRGAQGGRGGERAAGPGAVCLHRPQPSDPA